MQCLLAGDELLRPQGSRPAVFVNLSWVRKLAELVVIACVWLAGCSD